MAAGVTASMDAGIEQLGAFVPRHDQTEIGGVLTRIGAYPEHLQMIGLVVTDWSALEGRLSLTLWELVGSPDHGSIIFYTLANSRARIDVVYNLTKKLVESPIKNELLSALNEVRGLSGQRNRIVHGQWGIPAAEDKRANPFLALQDATDEKSWQHIYKAKEIRDLADSINRAEERIASINDVLRLRREPPQGEVLAHVNNLRALSPKYDAFLSKFL